MDLNDALPFLEANHQTVVATVRPDGQLQSTIIAAGPLDGSMAFVVRGATVKLRNILADPRCTVTVVTPDWRSFVTVEGVATLHTWDNTDAEEQRLLLRRVFTAAGGTHDDWDEYDRVMREQSRAAVLVHPQRVYGRF